MTSWLCVAEKRDKLSSESGGGQTETDNDMTDNFIRTAQQKRVEALTEMENRDLLGETARKAHRLPALTKRHIDDLFQSSKAAPKTNVGSLAA